MLSPRLHHPIRPRSGACACRPYWITVSDILRWQRAAMSAAASRKWALEGFAEALAVELAGFGIDVTLAEPGPISTGVLDNMLTYRLPDDP